MSGELVAAGVGAFSGFAGTTAGAAVLGGVASAGVGTLASKLLAPKIGGISIPPPPGAAMIDQQGADAAAALRRRAAVAGGLQSTITGAGNAPGANAGPTSGSKQLLGQ